MTLSRLVIVAFAIMILCAPSAAAMDIPVVIRGSGTILMLPEPGPLTMTFSKRDLNIYDGPDHMPISVVDPVGEEVVSIVLPCDGNTGRGPHTPEPIEETVTIDVQRRGLYRVMFSGGDYMFGMSANCDLYVVDSRFVFNDPNTAAEAYFDPPEGQFTVAAAALHRPGIQVISLHDAAGALISEFDLEEPVQDIEFTVGEDVGDRDGLWHWRIGKMNVRLNVPNVKYWTVDPASYFDPDEIHLLLAPRRTARYLDPGGSADYRIVLYPPEGLTEFEVEFTQPEQTGVRFELAEMPVQAVDYARDRMIVPVRAIADEDAAQGAVFDGYLEVTATENPLAAARALLQARVGPSPLPEPLEMPIVLRRYEHEDWQFGFAPSYEPNEVHFDRDNAAWIRHRTEHRHWSAGAQILEGEEWLLRPWTEAIREYFPGYQRPSSGSGFQGCRWAFDHEGGAWTTMRLTGTGLDFDAAVLYTPDRGQTWQVELVEGRLADLEAFKGHNDPGFPPVLAYRRTADHPARFCAYHDLLLYLPRVEGGRLVVPEPILVSDNCFGTALHSGAPPQLVTRDGRTHIVWGEVTDPDDPGVPTYVATYDHASGELSEKVFVAYAPPVNNVHSAPALVLDSEGYIHVVTGSHGDNFFYARSLRPNDISGGFTEPVKVHDAGWVDADTDETGRARQTYIGLVVDQEDTLHLVYRDNRSGIDDYLPEFTYYMGLSYQRKPKGGEWEPAQPLVIPPVGGYSIYYHKLTVDRLGNLYLSYSYWTNHAYASDFPGLYHNRALITSKDGGDTWKLVETRDFADAAPAH